MQDIVKCVGAQDVVFDSINHLGYECWMNEPKSVNERRKTFLFKMGFIEPSSSFKSNNGDDDNDDDEDDDGGGDGEPNFSLEDVLSSCSSSSNEHLIRQNLSIGEDDEPSTSNNTATTATQYGPTEVESEKDMMYTTLTPTSNNYHKSINKKIRHWWREMMKKQTIIDGCKCKVDNNKHQSFKMNRTKVQVNKKKFKELNALFSTQEIQAHKGMIWTMKFSPNGRFLATGGEDGVVRIWRIKSLDLSEEKPDLIHDKMFRLEEKPIQEFHGHCADVLDLSWSKTNLILSASMDKTVRLWELGSNSCVGTFYHTDYVTCVQFNPVNNDHFISGSIDGKVRIWGVSNQRVLDWADVRDAVTAVCYQPDGNAFVVGSLSGCCKFFEKKGDLFELSAHIQLHSNKRSTNRITGIQFSDSRRVMVMSEDSKLRILDRTRVVRKFRGLPKSGSQLSASFTPNNKHILSIGQDSRVYLWNNENPIDLYSKRIRSNRTCEHFESEGVSVALPWCSSELKSNVSKNWANPEHEVASNGARDFHTLSLSNIFGSKHSATWPEEMLQSLGSDNVAHFSTYGLVIVTANCYGKIKTYQNYL